MVRISSQLCVQWCQVGSLKSWWEHLFRYHKYSPPAFLKELFIKHLSSHIDVVLRSIYVSARMFGHQWEHCRTLLCDCVSGFWGFGPLYVWMDAGSQWEALHSWQRSWGRRLGICKGGIEPQESPWIYPPKKTESAYFTALCSYLWLYWGLSPTTILLSLTKS